MCVCVSVCLCVVFFSPDTSLKDNFPTRRGILLSHPVLTVSTILARLLLDFLFVWEALALGEDRISFSLSVFSTAKETSKGFAEGFFPKDTAGRRGARTHPTNSSSVGGSWLIKTPSLRGSARYRDAALMGISGSHPAQSPISSTSGEAVASQGAEPLRTALGAFSPNASLPASPPPSPRNVK